ncbi:MAG TPA: PilT/PilU family type 4a pilus ATPase [Candidatus Aquilonibacter sp.]
MRDVLRVAETSGASDMHFVPNAQPAIRVDGDLRFLDGPPLRADEISEMASTMFEPAAMESIEAGQDVTVTRETQDGGVLRIHGSRTALGPAIAIRRLPSLVPMLETLELPAVVETFVHSRHGLVVFCGPTGSGKSTSLAALVGEINRATSRRIVTIEEPIEFRHQSERSLVTQREIGRDATSFESALRGALRNDPDVIMIGEMRDERTIRSAISAAETGHLVLATLHSGGAVQAIDRMIDVFSEDRAQMRALLAAALTAVICQRLIPRARGGGRCAAAEILIVTDAVRTMIRECRTHHITNAIAMGRDLGMQTFDVHLDALVSAGTVDASAATGARG